MCCTSSQQSTVLSDRGWNLTPGHVVAGGTNPVRAAMGSERPTAPPWAFIALGVLLVFLLRKG